MDSKRFEAEIRYQTTMSTAKKMLKNGVIDEKDYREIDDYFIRKYKPAIGILMAEKELT